MDHLWILGPAVLLPLGIFICITAIVIVPIWLRAEERARMHETIRRLNESGQTMPPEIIDALNNGPTFAPPPMRYNNPEAELRRGLILIAVAVAMVILGVVIDWGVVVWPIVGAAAFPGLIGVASLVMWSLSNKLRN